MSLDDTLLRCGLGKHYEVRRHLDRPQWIVVHLAGPLAGWATVCPEAKRWRLGVGSCEGEFSYAYADVETLAERIKAANAECHEDYLQGIRDRIAEAKAGATMETTTAKEERERFFWLDELTHLDEDIAVVERAMREHGLEPANKQSEEVCSG